MRKAWGAQCYDGWFLLVFQSLAAGAVGRLCGAVPGKTGAALFSAWCKVAGVVAGCDLKKVAGW